VKLIEGGEEGRMNIVKFKGCLRCGGDLFLERASDGIDVTCLQCGATYFKHLELMPLVKIKARKTYAR
jgi:ribosomal protein S27AE